MKIPAGLHPLRHRRFRRLATAKTLSTFGSELSLVAIPFAVLGTSSWPDALGIVLMARTLPGVILMLLGGVWADRLSRARLMVSSDVASMVVQALLAVALLTHHSPLWLIAVLQALLRAAGAFFTPAAVGMTPATVPDDELQQANGTLGLAGNISGMLGPAVAGLIVVTAGPGWALLVDSLTFLGSASLLWSMRHEGQVSPRSDGKRGSVWAELAEGWREVRTRRWLVTGIVQSLLFQASFAVFFVLGPVAARSSLGGAGAWGLLVTAFGVGSLAGGLLALRIEPARPLLALEIALLASTPAMAALSLTTHLYVLVLTTALAGAGFAAADTFWATTLQRETPQEQLGKVAAFDAVGSSFLRPFGYLLAASMAAAVGESTTLRGASLLLVASVPLALLLAPEIARMARTGISPSVSTPDAEMTRG